MKFLSVSRLSHWDVKWANQIKGNFGVYMIEHSNPHYEMVVVTHGPIYLQVGAEKLTLQTGEFLLLNLWEPHFIWKRVEEHASFFFVQFSSNPSMPLLREWTKQDLQLHFIHMNHKDLRIDSDDVDDFVLLPRHFQPSRFYELLVLFEKLLQTIHQPKGYFRLRLSVYLIQIIDLIANDYLEQYHLDTSLPTTYLTYRKIIMYLNERYTSDIDKEDIEKFMSLNYEYLGQIFKKYANIPMVSYVQQLRVQKSKFLLMDNLKTINEIAGEVGYQDALYFSRVFKKWMGVSPQGYRNMTEKQDS